ncbi:type II secretion system F family protein [Ferrimonas pelagia]|uniref:Type II secretion system F family protein n=1 Tax=Ferrimonas pelagia TaxID=1177826 RepID=A0ABP9EJP7_9GAMM
MSVQIIFLGCVFIAVLLLSQALFIPITRPQRGNTKVVRERLAKVAQAKGTEGEVVSIAMENRLKKASSLGLALEKNAFIHELSFKLQQSGSNLLGYQYVLRALLTAGVLAAAVWFWQHDPLYALFAFVLVLMLFNIKLNRQFNNRMELLEEQFPEALDVVKRALQAGYSFTDAVRLTSEEMSDPIAHEFKILFSDINYGKDTRRALLHMIERIPSVSAMAFSTVVQVQKETGGNLAENINNLSVIIRKRFAFRRKVKTLSAEGRMSAWVLTLTPLVLFALLFVTSPDYANELVDSEEGNRLMLYGGIGMLLGIYWLSRLIRIEV